MTKKILTISLSFITLVAAGIGTAEAAQWITGPEDGLFWKTKIEEGRIPTVQEVSRAERQRIALAKEDGHEKRLLENKIESNTPQDQEDVNLFPGIQEGGDVPAPFSSREFRVMNYWSGDIDGQRIGVYAGYDPQNPTQGVLALTDDKENPKGTYYPAPATTGPVQVTSEKDGVLTLMSVGGPFEVLDENALSPRTGQTSGNAVYVFDVRKKSYR